jgi:hypothetical protein
MSIIPLTPTSAYRGDTVTISGTGLRANVKLILLADGVMDPYNSKFRASRTGTFTIGYVIPATATYSSHTLRIQSLSSTNQWVNEGNLITLTVLQVTPPVLPPLVISNVIATSITQTGVTIGWSLSDYATGQIEYGKTISYGTLSTPELSYTYKAHIQTLSGLSAGTLYHYRVKSTTQDGRSAVSSDYIFTTLGTVLVVPVAPTGLVATNGNSLVNLIWGAVTLATSYKIYRNNVAIGTATSPSFTNTGLTNGVSYSFKVSAVNAVGEGPFSNVVSATPIVPSGRMFPAPVTTGTYTVPNTIDATGATDVQSALDTFIGTVPNGSIVSFPIGATYRLNTALRISGRNNLVFEGHGATLQSRGGSGDADSTLTLVGCQHITIRNMTIAGNSSTPGIFIPGQESAYAIRLIGSNSDRLSATPSYIEIGPNVTLKNSYGDNLSVDYWADQLWMYQSSNIYSGRNGVAILAAKNVLIENNTFEVNGGGILDLEAYQASGGATNLTFRNNTCGSHGYGFFDANGSDGAVVTDITVTGNTVTGGTLGGRVDSLPRRQNVVFTNNTSTSTAQSPAEYVGRDAYVRYFGHIDGLTVTGNTQPLPAGASAFMNAYDNTNAVTSPNP